MSLTTLTVKIYDSENNLIYCGLVEPDAVQLGEEINQPRTARITLSTVDFISRLEEAVPTKEVSEC